MKLLYFGTYEKPVVRNRVIRKGLSENGVEVLECHVPLWEKQGDKTGNLFRKRARLLLDIISAQFLLFTRSMKVRDYDVMLVGYIGQFDMFTAKLVSIIRRKPLVFDPLVSLSETLFERGMVTGNSPIFTFAKLIDKWSFRLADLIILDSNENIKYFSKNYGIRRNKFCRVYVGAEKDLFYPRQKKSRKFIVCFFGQFSPNHGIEYIVEAAKILKNDHDIEFHLIGRGQIFNKVRDMTSGMGNVKLLGHIEYGKLPECVKEADVCLGMLKDTEKIRRVTATKIFESIAMGKPVITGDCRAVRETLKDGENAILCRFDDAKDLSEKILVLKNDRKLREKISVNAYKLFREHYSEERIGQSVMECFREKGYW
jgi:glycosyltransferase involved in cell wall biosynthesis